MQVVRIVFPDRQAGSSFSHVLEHLAVEDITVLAPEVDRVSPVVLAAFPVVLTRGEARYDDLTFFGEAVYGLEHVGV